MNIGIEEHTKLIYEGAALRFGYPLWPSPMMFQVVIASEDDDVFTPAKQNDLAPQSYIFREDTYNSSSRVRRGRLYQAEEFQPPEWSVYPHPALPNEIPKADRNGGTLKKRLYSFSSFRLQPHLVSKKIKRPIFLLGAENGFTIWTLVNVEISATGDELIVLRARKSIGALPHMNREKIIVIDGKSILELVDKLEDELFRAGPESVVDRSREAATAILSKYLQSIEKAEPGKDLGKLANKIAIEGFEIVANSAKIIARLHARGKYAEQEKNHPRLVTEQDAEYAVQAVATILCDLDLAHW